MDDLSDVVGGRWYVVATSLPFWRRRTDPTITYTALPDDRVLDVVSYRRRGHAKLVVGVDTADGSNTGSWRWRGLGPVTRLTTSRWRVVAADETVADPTTRWAVTAFEKDTVHPGRGRRLRTG